MGPCEGSCGTEEGQKEVLTRTCEVEHEDNSTTAVLCEGASTMARKCAEPCPGEAGGEEARLCHAAVEVWVGIHHN